MATPKYVRVIYDINTNAVSATADAWADVADNTDAAQREARELHRDYAQMGSQGSRNVDRVRQSMAANTAETNSLRGALRGLLGPLAAVATAGAAISIAKGAIQAAASYESLNVALETFLGSASSAKNVLADLDKFSASTPFTPDQVNQSARALLAFGEPVEQLEGTLRRIGDVAAGTGKDFQELSVIYGKARVAGVLMAEDINQLTEAGVPIIQEFAKVLDTTPDKVKKMGSEGKITFPVFEKAFANLSAEGGRFNGLMEKLSQTTEGKLSTLEGNIQVLGRAFGNVLLPVVNGVVGALSSFITSITDTRSKAQRLYDEAVAGNKAFAEQESQLNGLVSEYESLSSRTDLNEQEQQRLKDVIEELSHRVPEATTAFDEYGNALGINTEAVKSNIERQREIAALRNAEALKEITNEVKSLTFAYSELQRAQRAGVVGASRQNLQRGLADSKSQVQEYKRLQNELLNLGKGGQKEAETLMRVSGRTIEEERKRLEKNIALLTDPAKRGKQADAIKLVTADIADLLLKAKELGRELTPQEAAFIKQAAGIDVYAESTKKSSDETTSAAYSIDFLQAKIKGLRESLEKAEIGSAEFAATQTALKTAENELARVLGKKDKFEAQKGSISDLKKEISDLKTRIDGTVEGSDRYAALLDSLSEKETELEIRQARLNREFLRSVGPISETTRKIAELEQQLSRGRSSFDVATIAKLEKELESLRQEASKFITGFDPGETLTNSIREVGDAITDLGVNLEENDQFGQTIWEQLGLTPEKQQAALDTLQQGLDFISQLQANKRAQEEGELNAQEERRLEAVKGNSTAEQAIREEFAEKRKALNAELAESERRLAVFQAIVDTAAAVAKALASAPPPFSFIQAALAAAAGGAQITAIRAQAFAKGGPVEGGTRGKDSVPIWAMPGEWVLPVAAVRKNKPLIERMQAGEDLTKLLRPDLGGRAPVRGGSNSTLSRGLQMLGQVAESGNGLIESQTTRLGRKLDRIAKAVARSKFDRKSYK